ncbi:MAG: helix-turn-helix domain-containing protein [Clostridiales bacterium]|nr:helix-turn-helix domain-containing protein [Clostridiales bacterium]
MQDKVKQYIKDNGLKQRFIAQKLGLSDPVFSLWFKGKTILRNHVIQQIREMIGE